jgi:glutamate/tyrosine decarboxylase-like PLP-dependent enzyme
MSAVDFIAKNMSWMPGGVSRFLEKRMKTIPAVQKMIAGENDKITAQLEHSLKPYKGKFDHYSTLPKDGISREKVLEDLQKMYDLEVEKWKDGYVSGGIYHGDQEHIDFLNKVYALQSQSNPLHSDIFPSTVKMEAEVIAMVATMHGQGKTTENAQIVGTLNSGGTESILLAMKTYRDKALEEKGITEPEMIVCVSAHAAFDKASQYFGIKQVKIPFNDDFSIDIAAVEKAINRNTIVLVGSAPTFPHGIIDDIAALSHLAVKHDIGLHTDCCLGGFILPFAEQLGYKVPVVDFRLPGVTSMSVDTHKYGYAAKGTSVVLYRSEELRHYQFYTTTEWPGGLYFSPTLAGSRPGALSAACWAAMVTMGENGYLKATQAIVSTAEKMKAGMAGIPELKILGNPLWIISFGSDVVNIYEVLDQMSKRKWNLNGLHKPACVHLAVTLRHTQPGVAERFIQDLKDSVEHVKANPGEKGGMAPVYGMGGSLPFRGMVSDILKKTLDVLYKV